MFVLLAHAMRVSAIVVLLLGGVLVGPYGLNLIAPDVLGEGLKTIIGLSVGLILFEGGLTLDPKGYRQASREIVGMLTVGVLITWAGSALTVHYVFGHSWPLSFLSGSLIIVTGPTVIAPLLKRIRVKKRLHHILHWEGVLIDPIGVFAALLCFEWIIGSGEKALNELILRIVIGVGIGLIAGLALAGVIRKRWVPADHLNIFAIASAIGIFALSDLVAHESGLLSVTIAGFVVGSLAGEQVKQLKRYKAELIELLIGLLFVLLAAKLDISKFQQTGWQGILAVALVMFVARPANIFASTLGSSLSLREKLFLSWIAPRGIVAASMASLFALSLQERNEQAWFLEIFTYSVIAGTVLVQGFSAGAVGKLLNVLERHPSGWLIAGAHPLARAVAKFILKCGKDVVLIDTDPRNIAQARRSGLNALCDDALTVTAEEYPELFGIGNVLAVTTNSGLNLLICERWHQLDREVHLYRYGVQHGMQPHESDSRGQIVWDQLALGKMVTANVQEHDLRLFVSDTEPAKLRHPDRVLMCAQADELQPAFFGQPDQKCQVLSFLPFDVRPEFNTSPNWIIISEATTLTDLFRELLDRLAQNRKIDIPALEERLEHQCNDYSCYIGYEVGLPHAYTDDITESVVLVAKLKKSITCQLSGESLRVIFLVISPESAPKQHLSALAEISRFIMDDGNRRALMDAEDEDDLMRPLFPVTDTS